MNFVFKTTKMNQFGIDIIFSVVTSIRTPKSYCCNVGEKMFVKHKELIHQGSICCTGFKFCWFHTTNTVMRITIKNSENYNGINALKCKKT